MGTTQPKMDAIRKKMQSMKAETDDMYKKISKDEATIKEANGISDKFDADIRDTGKKVQKLESGLEETCEKLQQSASKMEEAEKEFKDKEDDVNAQARRCVLMEEESRISIEKLATTILKLANMSKEAESRSEYAEMNISKLHLRIDELEDEIIREKL